MISIVLAAISAFILPHGGRTPYGVRKLISTNTVPSSSVTTVRMNCHGALTVPLLWQKDMLKISPHSFNPCAIGQQLKQALFATAVQTFVPPVPRIPNHYHQQAHTYSSKTHSLFSNAFFAISHTSLSFTFVHCICKSVDAELITLPIHKITNCFCLYFINNSPYKEKFQIEAKILTDIYIYYIMFYRIYSLTLDPFPQLITHPSRRDPPP
jgi:hypothetical protein